MPDDEPVSTTVSETVTTDTGADKQTADSLEADFKDFWKEEDSKSDGAPAAPGDGASQETRETKEPRRETKEAEAETPEPKPETKEYSDEDIERLALTNKAGPDAIEDFKQLKNIIKSERSRAKAEAERASKLEKDLSEARQNSWTPEAKADYEHAAAVRRKFDFANDPEFQARFHAPIQQTYHGILNEAIGMLPDRNAATAWARYIAENYVPEQLDKNWWNHSVLEKIPDEMDRDLLRTKVNRLREMQQERDSEVERRTNDKSAFENWNKEKNERTEQWTRKEVMDEIGIQEQKVKEILKKDPSTAKTKEEREAIDKHNERFEKLNGHFQETMKDLTFNGPRAWVRAAVQATRAEYMEGEYKNLEKELKSTKDERDQLKKELDKIGGARRRISHTTGTPPTPSGKEKSNNGLSIKNLDVRDSFKNFDWGDGS
jgi:hypothetical protein